jgi:hypothetical protein
MAAGRQFVEAGTSMAKEMVVQDGAEVFQGGPGNFAQFMLTNFDLARKTLLLPHQSSSQLTLIDPAKISCSW